MTEQKYVAIDGDDVGRSLEEYIVSNDLESLASYSTSVANYFLFVRSFLEASGHRIIFCGGDSVMSCSPGPVALSAFKQLPAGPCSVSIGIGSTPVAAFLALRLAKARGKRKIVCLEYAQNEQTFDL